MHNQERTVPHGHNYPEHPHADEPTQMEAGELPTELIELTSVGIDIGSATTQIVFSSIKLQRMGWELSSRYQVFSQQIIGDSGLHLTPYLDGTTIDADGVAVIVARAYQDAGLAVDQVDSGAVILTGEATRRENSRALADTLAASGGEFVCATAGHHMEANLAAHGSGSVRLSRKLQGRILNIDIGGGTTKLAVVDRGTVSATAAVHIGGRLVAFHDGLVVHMDPGGKRLAELSGVPWTVGSSFTPEEIETTAEWMADAIVESIQLGSDARPEVAELFLTDSLGHGQSQFDAIVCSGGVAEYIYGLSDEDHNDLGRALGRAVRERIETQLPWALAEARERGRATVIGVSQYSVQVSGNTIYMSETVNLPAGNVQVLRPDINLEDEVDVFEVATSINQRFVEADLVEGEQVIALAMTWTGSPSFERVFRYAEGVAAALHKSLTEGNLVCLVFDGDVGGSVGGLIGEEFHPGSSVISIDGVSLGEFDFIDIGRRLLPSGAVPVSIKSLLFSL